MKHNDWTEQMRRRLDNAEADVPDMLWSAIEQKLDERSAAGNADTRMPQRSRTTVLWRWAAAASVAVVAGAALWWHTARVDPALPHDTRLQGTLAYNNGAATQTATGGDMSRLADGGAAAVAHRATGGTGQAAHGNSDPAECAANDNLAACCSETAHGSQPANTEEAASDCHAHEASPGQTPATAKRVPPTAMLRSAAHGSEKSGRQPHWQVGVGTSGNMARYSSAGGVVPVTYSGAQPSGGFGNTLFVAEPMQRDIKEKTRHNMPLSFGLTVAYRLTERWSLSSGAVYTIATSSFEHGTSGNVSTDEQTLHYIGIPLNASYTVWGNRTLKTYVTAGAQADFNIAAKVETDGHTTDMPKDRVQMSVGGGLGLQLNLVKQMGIYVEPGVKYYFDNGSNVQNVFKEHPCNFSLQVGLRYNIK